MHTLRANLLASLGHVFLLALQLFDQNLKKDQPIGIFHQNYTIAFPGSSILFSVCKTLLDTLLGATCCYAKMVFIIINRTLPVINITTKLFAYL